MNKLLTYTLISSLMISTGSIYAQALGDNDTDQSVLSKFSDNTVCQEGESMGHGECTKYRDGAVGATEGNALDLTTKDRMNATDDGSTKERVF